MKKGKEQQTRFLSQAIQLEEAVNPAIVRTTMAMISTLILVFIVWSAFTNVNEVARSPGEIIPIGQSQSVQHLDGGLVAAIHVEEGQKVQKGDLLLRLDGAGSQDDLKRARSKQISLALQQERLRSFLEGRAPDFSNYAQSHPGLVRDQRVIFDSMVNAHNQEEHIIREQIEQKERMISSIRSDIRTEQANYAIMKDLYDRRKNLNEQGYASDIQFLETKQKLNDIGGKITQLKNRINVAEAEIREFNMRLESLGANQADEAYKKLDALVTEMAQNAELIAKLSAKVARLDVRAPVSGTVKGLGVNTIGAVVQPASMLMEIVPKDEALVAQVKIQPRHIGQIAEGQKVHVKFSSFDFSRYGAVSGKLQKVSATTFSDENGERYFQGQVLLDRQYVGANENNMIIPGMTVMADIITGEKTILDYLLKPIRTSVQTAFRER